MWIKVKKTIRNAKRFVITSHIDPDGDALGSELALYHFLKSLGKQVVILNSTAPAKNFSFMSSKQELHLYNEKKTAAFISQAEVIFILDISEWDRLGKIGAAIKASKAVKVCIDHHVCENHFADIQLIDTQAASTGELIYQLIKKMRKKLTPAIAEALYVSALTDTGSFRYQNTSSKTHLMVAELLQYGVKPLDIFSKIYEQYRPERFRLLGDFLLSMQCENQIAWGIITKKMVKKAKASIDETEGFVEILRTIHSVEVAIIFRESEKNKTKVSFRSKESADVHKIAKKFGGGGHQRASGATVDLPLTQTVSKVLKEVRKELK